MSDQPPVSGVDLARVALQAARASAKAAPPPKRRTGAAPPRQARSGGRDPMGLGAAIGRMVTDRGWEQATAGGNLVAQWPTIAPALAGHVTAVRYDEETRTLHLLPATATYRTQLTLHQRDIITRINAAAGPDSVRRLEILRPADLNARSAEAPQRTAPVTPTVARPPAEAPVKTREDASEGYHQALAAHRAAVEARADSSSSPLVRAAAERQIRERAREPEELFGDGRKALEELRAKAAAQQRGATSSDAARARALQRLAAERAGLTTLVPPAPAPAPRRLDQTA
ncbi:DciA family protein [Streptomyces sp. NPDC008125]|uniref:DciA family protein n=1 Tax=Streptomyces sp. NPDC008125 TaxID=3364811 RepID=UPI0036E8353B